MELWRTGYSPLINQVFDETSSAKEQQMIFDSLKRILANLSKSATPDFTTEVEATGDIISGVSVLHTKIKHLNEFRQACDEVGLGDDFHKAAISAHAFEGNPYYGKTSVLGTPYVSGYEPIKDVSGATIGVYFVGYTK
jgi:Single cache domain 3